MTTTEEMFQQRDAVLEDLKSSWLELDVAREQYVQDPLNPMHPGRMKELALISDKLSDDYARVSRELFGVWYGIEQ
ncbi:MAG: hypothetical protein QF898_12605 [SAR202 cluster bacterium]|nr:hypothetical protein [SAR202 cluster bacterium]MDP6714547.1 hypothetical protein [SAR202 cluster bacterium]